MTDSPQQLPLNFFSHHNQSLFSDHYLDEILRRSESWRRAIPQAQVFLAWLRDLYAQEKEQLAHYNEDQLEDKWFKPIFAQLGYDHWEGQAIIPGWQGGIKKPDFFFFPDAAARHTAVSQQNTTAYAQSALAVGEVKQWGVNLSKKTGRQPIFADQNPMYQIDTYLSLTGLAWGILSNGRHWRLLHKSSARTLETYFEIDLLAALEQPDETKATAVATYFWLFFRQAALRPDGDGRVFLDDARTQSRDYAIALEADLRDNAYRALEQLIIGFFAGDSSLDAANPTHRAQVYQNSLYLLYRLLFIFYGESRALLPVAQPLYQEQYALQQVARQIDQRRSALNSLPTTGKSYWNRLRELFRLISGVDAQLNADLGVPRYNGGLFDPAQHPFLEQHFVGDRALALAIDYLATRRIILAGGRPEYQRVDYRTLDVRQLGSIYEGLLEYKVVVATEEMVTVSQKGVETWLPLAQRGKAKSYGDRRQPGELYLTTDKGERKATGSYYTPDYIVEYIVAQTLGPLVAQVRERVRASAGSAAGSAAAQQQSADLFIKEILRLNVLDPAMGSGHFLVEATNYLARVLATDEYVQVRQQTSDFSEKSDVSTAETDLLYWKRRVVEACIYGVDKNPMAVELAKLSLWLKTAAADKPLSFLDHHLQCGDSLIGAWLADLERAPQPTKPDRSSETCQVSFTRDLGLAVKGVATIERLPTLDIETVHAKEAAWRSIQQTHMARWRQLADLWVSAYFGNGMSAAEYRALAERLQGRESLMNDEQAAHFLNHTAVTDNDYFHWELAFPEVFFDEYGHPLGEAAGFDAVIGNPPYINANDLKKTLSDYEKPFWKTVFKTAMGAYDIYVLFFEQGLRLVKNHQCIGYITPNKYLAAPYAIALREFLPLHHTLESIYDVSHIPVFGDASVYPIVTVIRRGKQNSDSQIIEVQIAETKERSRLHSHNSTLLSYLPDNIWGFLLSTGVEIIKKTSRGSVPLSEVAEVVASTTASEADEYSGIIIEQNAVLGRAIPIVNTGVIDRYLSLWSIQLLTHQGKQYKQPVLPLDDSRVPERRKRQYLQSKLIFAKVALCIEAICDLNGQYASMNTNFAIAPKERVAFLASICNSKLLSWIYSEYFGALSMSGGYLQFQAPQLSVLPIKKIEFSTPYDKRTAVLSTTQTHYQQGDYPAVLVLAGAELAAGRNDTVHDILAFLAEQMISLNKEKQAALEAFWLDMEGVSEAATFAALRGKGKQQASLHQAVPAARAFVRADSRGSVGLDASLEWNEEAFKGFVKLLAAKVPHFSDMVAVYRRHAPGVAALAQRLSATDHLIDQIVYRLYGLTAEEITIVEGTPGQT